MEWYLRRMEAKRRGEKFPPGDNSPSRIKWIFYVSWGLILFSGASYGCYCFYEKISTWAGFKSLVSTSGGATGTTEIVLIAGVIFFLLRSRMRFSYAVLELAVAAATTYDGCIRATSRSHTILVLFGATYVVVRACENFSKWWKEEILRGGGKLTSKPGDGGLPKSSASKAVPS